MAISSYVKLGANLPVSPGWNFMAARGGFAMLDGVNSFLLCQIFSRKSRAICHIQLSFLKIEGRRM
jgi:hypothetical protein